jgi:hypothetical protein
VSPAEHHHRAADQQCGSEDHSAGPRKP